MAAAVERYHLLLEMSILATDKFRRRLTIRRDKKANQARKVSAAVQLYQIPPPWPRPPDYFPHRFGMSLGAAA